MKWIPGRQKDVEYYKLLLWRFKFGRFGFDAYIIKFKAGTKLGIHVDKVANGKHYRLNINLKGKSLFCCRNEAYWSRINFFRPDIDQHGLSVLTNSKILSFGFVKFKKDDV